MGFWIIGTDHLKDRTDMQGVNFNGIQDKKTAPMPNEGNRCAYERCALGFAVAEGAAARFALVGQPNQWCHKECAERWEQEVRSGIAKAPVPETKLCGAPHPEIVGASCAREEHPGGNHLLSADHGRLGWYMEAKDVERLKLNLADPVPPYVHGDAMRGEPEEISTLVDDFTSTGTDWSQADAVPASAIGGTYEHPDVAVIDAIIEEAYADEDVPEGYSEPVEPEELTFTHHDIGAIVSKMHLENQAMRARLADLDPEFDLEAALKERRS